MAALYAVRQGDVEDAFRFAEVLAHDDHELVQKPVGGVLREAGKRDRDRLLAFLDAHAASLPRVLLRNAIEHLDADTKAHHRAQR